ncbi:MAG: PIG-L family deacetylase [Sediminibacterium sp.]
MKKILSLLVGIVLLQTSMHAQQNAASIYAGIKKLGVMGSVLYIAAHPDDENNSFLPYLTKEKNYRTAYLSLTRGDGGQNLIGKEQGIELGLIRTQELLAARRIDGAEQYFSTAYEFGFSKSADEALTIWDHQKVLSDVVWVIRQYQPDIIITRFPGDARAGHGHHAASSIIANEAYLAAADPTKFPEQLKKGVSVWKAKRILWNTFNFGSVNTTSNNQFKLEVGGYNVIEGKSYGEIGAEARTMHKSQGEGRPRRRGASYEFFETTGGEAPVNDLMDGIDISWSRLGAASIQTEVNNLVKQFQIDQPSSIVPSLVALYTKVKALPNSVWKNYQLLQIQSLIKDAAGIFIEASTQKAQVIPGENLGLQVLINQRSSVNTQLLKLQLPSKDSLIQKTLGNNQNTIIDYTFKVDASTPISQPYWLVEPKTEGMFIVNDYSLIGKAENDPAFTITAQLKIEGVDFYFPQAIQYKYTDPTKGDVYQPLAVIPAKETKYNKEVYLMKSNKPIEISYQQIDHQGATVQKSTWIKNANESLPTNANDIYRKTIQYDHIPTLNYFTRATTKIVPININTKKATVGYIDGAGDKLPEALTELGYHVVLLKESDINKQTLAALDAIVVGIRAYNMYEWITEKNDLINEYIQQGGNYIVQYLKSNQVGINKVKVGPYAFSVNGSRRVTQENVPVDFVLPNHPVLNTPNKISADDFANWVQERSTYQAENIDTHFEMPLSMHDANEPASNGSLLIAPYGKGNMVYASITLFRQLPAGNPGAYKLLANLVELPKH